MSPNLGKSLARAFHDGAMSISHPPCLYRMTILGFTRFEMRALVEMSAVVVLLGLAYPFIFVHCRWNESSAQPPEILDDHTGPVRIAERWFQARHNELYTPLPPRKRALTLPLPPFYSPGYLRRRGKGRMKDQLQSVLVEPS